MECKVVMHFYVFVWVPVLIETLWNVKTVGDQYAIYVDTCINRNIVECKEALLVPLCPLYQKSINRNIVECKVNAANIALSGIASINRNIVECKVVNSYMPCATIICINRNIVECKDERGYAES